MALKLDDKPETGDYDDNQPGWRTPSTDDIGDLERAYNAPSATDSDLPDGHPDKKSSGGAQAIAGSLLKKSEKGAGTDIIGGGYKTEGSRFSRLKVNMSSAGKRKAAIGGGIGGGIMVMFIAIFMSLVPLKIVGMMSSIQSKFFAPSESAVEKQSDNLANYYLKKHVLPSLGKKCPSTRVNKDCMGDIPGSNKTQKLYRAWKDSRLETKLAENYGIEFEKTGNGYKMVVPGDADTLIPGDFTAPGNTKTLSELSRPEVRAKFHEALAGETKLKRVFYRFKVGRLLERKYAIKRCVVACDLKDNYADWKDDKKRAAKVLLSQRILEPNAEAKALILECILNGGCNEDGTKDSDGRKRDGFEEKLSVKLKDYEKKYGTKALKSVISEANSILDKQFSTYVTEKVVGMIAGKTAGAATAQVAEKGIPVVGWIDGAAKVIKTTADAGGHFKKWAFVTNSTGMVALYQMYRTHADEIKSGHVDAELVGSFTSALDTGAKKDGTGAAAEDSPLYQNLFGSSKPTSTALLDTIVPSKANAAAVEKCDDGTDRPAGQLICPEESLATSNILTSFSSLFNGPPLSQLKTIADLEQASLGKALAVPGDLLGKLIEGLPGFSAISEKIGDIAGGFLKGITDKLVYSPISDNMSGLRNVDMIIGGADVAGNRMAEDGLGGQKLTNGQVAEIRNEQTAKANHSFNNQPFFARMFDSSNQYSLVSRVAMAMPTNTNTAMKTSVTSLLSNPFSKLSHGFAAILSPAQVFAAETPADDPFHIPQAGYALNNPVFTTDPETYTEEYCSKLTEAWNAATVVDEATGMDVHTTTNPCLLNDAAIGSAGGAFTDEVLSPGDVSTATASSSSSATGSTGLLAPGALSWPTDVRGSGISQCYKQVFSGGGRSGHHGIDIFQSANQPVYASADGKVTFAGPADGYGSNFVILEHSPDEHTSYGHMNSKLVAAGDTVKQGQQIGTIGNQGFSFGAHLHFNLILSSQPFPGNYYQGNADPLKNGLQIPQGEANPAGCTN